MPEFTLYVLPQWESIHLLCTISYLLRPAVLPRYYILVTASDLFSDIIYLPTYRFIPIHENGVITHAWNPYTVQLFRAIWYARLSIRSLWEQRYYSSTITTNIHRVMWAINLWNVSSLFRAQPKWKKICNFKMAFSSRSFLLIRLLCGILNVFYHMYSFPYPRTFQYYWVLLETTLCWC